MKRLLIALLVVVGVFLAYGIANLAGLSLEGSAGQVEQVSP